MTQRQNKFDSPVHKGELNVDVLKSLSVANTLKENPAISENILCGSFPTI